MTGWMAAKTSSCGWRPSVRRLRWTSAQVSRTAQANEEPLPVSLPVASAVVCGAVLMPLFPLPAGR